MHYLTEKDIITLNIYVINKYSPKEQIGVKEPTALNMLVNAPKQYVFGQEQYPTIELKGANLVRNIVKKHVFHNGNKRTAFISLIVFLELNGYKFMVSNKEAVNYMVKLATEDINEDEIAVWIWEHSQLSR
ncbi:prophage maintenance system killer protein (DOC: death-on-curing) [Mammaliicoccus sciuri]|uniref:type II toxin-antitoxin system death-on-curing family toxin n=1 Tax=Mammaliicoccus sciuri TaxID=1296 RepID=UPI00073422C3|nr:type II toxin-antitoxin system death-on-curing family toxin [Mammaliicoccus sciuri]KTT79941.1 prophage maintenance system killer protein (DOC: death-on-curing) [Mammaliicoccus sciuri]KTT88319.1 prophage maintenance system killer protein (DOC: death-on-curing) [Mammaliicoccus sciuri]KTT89814.1 prophage maintenance system killer protein (DOC: death-on-curing) [Mammaliicoccus sciuri]KTT95276.1 prophage maintenance system killer protein (DOC: death-on-curing) [Mammaliicoccus sciuri]KTW10328.1 p